MLQNSPFTFLGDLGDPATEERVQYIHNVKAMRLAEKPGSATQQLDVCNQIPENITAECGYHRQCNTSFTSNNTYIVMTPTELGLVPSCGGNIKSNLFKNFIVFYTVEEQLSVACWLNW